MNAYQKRVLAEIGMVVLNMQTTERLIAFALTYAIPESRIRSIDDIAGAQQRYSKQTLGKLVQQLKMRVEIADDFSDVLQALFTGQEYPDPRRQADPGVRYENEDRA